MHSISNLFYFGTTPYMFLGRSFRPSSGVWDCTHSIIPCRFCGCLLASSHRTCMV